MISVIICSRNADIDPKLKSNIAQTIGCDYELIVIDNSKSNYSMFSAYNRGVELSNGNILCFMHEDIFYHTQDWGKKVEHHFQVDSQLGLIGNLGSHYMPKCVCSVGDSGLLSSNYYTKDKEDHVLNARYFDSSGKAEVVVVDGMWYCIDNQAFRGGKI